MKWELKSQQVDNKNSYEGQIEIQEQLKKLSEIHENIHKINTIADQIPLTKGKFMQDYLNYLNNLMNREIISKER